jgi:hypothetical protein
VSAGGPGFGAAPIASGLMADLPSDPVSDPTPLTPQDRESLDLADAVEAGITSGHVFLEDGRVVTWEVLTPDEPEPE